MNCQQSSAKLLSLNNISMNAHVPVFHLFFAVLSCRLHISFGNNAASLSESSCGKFGRCVKRPPTRGTPFFTATFLLDFKWDDTMARIRCLVSPSCHLIPSVSLAPFHFSTYLPRSANHISVRRVTCFPVLQQPTLHDALQQIYQLVLTSPRLLRRSVISAAFDRRHRSSCAHGSFDLVRSPPCTLMVPANSERHVPDCICLRNQRVMSLDSVTISCVKVAVAHVSHIIMLNMKRAQ